MQTYRLSFYKAYDEEAFEEPLSPLKIAIISPGKSTNQFKGSAPLAVIDLQTDRLAFDYPDEILNGIGDGDPFEGEPITSFDGQPTPNPDPALTTYRLAVYTGHYYQRSQIALLGPGWRPEDAHRFKPQYRVVQVIDLGLAELPVQNAYTNELLNSISASEAHDKRNRELDEETLLTPEQLAAIDQHFRDADREILDNELKWTSLRNQKLYGDTTADRLTDALPDPPDDWTWGEE